MSEPKSDKLLILGTGAFAEDIADIAEECGYDIVGFIESKNRQRCSQMILDKKIFWVDEIGHLAGKCKAVCALGTTLRDGFVAQVQNMGFEFTSVIDPTARLSRRCHIDVGTVIGPGVIIAAGAKVGKHVLINRGALIGHHVNIADFVTVGPGANLGGNSNIEEKVYVGIGSIILNNCQVGRQSLVAAGAVVVKDVPQEVQVKGLPAKIAKECIGGF